MLYYVLLGCAIVGLLAATFTTGYLIGTEMTKRRMLRNRQIWVIHKGRTTQLDSKWELYTFKWLRDNGYNFIPQPKPPIPYIDRLGKARTYTADFLVFDTENGNYLIEVKPRRFYSRRVKQKLRDASARNKIRIIVWTEVDLKAMGIFEYKAKR